MDVEYFGECVTSKIIIIHFMIMVVAMVMIVAAVMVLMMVVVIVRPRNKSGRYTGHYMTGGSLNLPVTAEFMPVIVTP